MFFKRIKILFIALIVSYSAKGQFSETIKNTFIEVDYGYGFIVPHHEFIDYTLDDHIKTLDIKLTKRTYGNKYWNQLYNYPLYGIGFYRSNLGNNEVYGYANAVYSFVKSPIFGLSDKTNLSWQISFGASYISKCFDIETNPQNLAIGTNLNIFIDFSLQSSIPLSKRLTLNNSVRFTHFSNGKVKSPNTGLNIAATTIGLSYQLDKNTKPNMLVELPTIKNKFEYQIIYAAGIKSISEYEPGYYYASSLVFDFNKNYSLTGRWGIGADLFFDETRVIYSNQPEKSRITNSDLYQVGLHLGHDLVMGNLSLVINAGAYVFAPVNIEAPIYTRIGLRYRFKNHIIVNYTLKAHWAMASYIEWGVGYVF